MKIINQPEKDPDTGSKKVLVEIDEDDSKILEQSLKAFEKYDTDDKKYIVKLEHDKEMIHKIWALLHPS